MKNTITLRFLVSALSVLFVAQILQAQQTNSQVDWSPLKFLVGEWTGEGGGVARISLAADAWLDFEPGWLSAEEAARCLAAVRAEVTWARREIVLYGKRIMQPRLVGWAGDVPYRYSGQTLEPRPFTETVHALTGRVNEFAGTRFNHVLLNRYRDGHDNMGMHADDEPELGPSGGNSEDDIPF